MEVIFSIFRILSSFLTDNLYEQALVNNLFTFDLNKKTVSIKKKQKKQNYSGEDDVKIYNQINPSNLSPKLSQNAIIQNDDLTINTKNKLSDEGLNKNKTNHENLLISRTLKVPGRKKKYKLKTNFSSNLAKIEINNLDNKNVNDNKMHNQKDIYNIEGNDFNMSNSNEEKEIDKDKDQRKIIERVK